MKNLKNNFFIPLLLITLLTFNKLHAQNDSIPLNILTPQDAISKTLAGNLNIKISENTTNIAKNNSGLLNSGYLPTLSGSAGAEYSKDDSEAQFRDGSTAEATGIETRRYNAAVNVNYLLFDGLGRYYDYKRFKETYNLSELDTRKTIETTILQLFTVYYEVARLKQENTNLKIALEVSKERYTRAKNAFEYGQNTGLDVLNAEVDVNTDSINVLNSNLFLSNAKRDLNLVMNVDLQTQFEVDTSLIFLPTIEVENYINAAKVNNVDILRLDKSLTINDYNLKAAKGNYLPTIGLNGSYGWNESNSNSPISFLTSNTTSGLNAGINLTWNLFDGGITKTTVNNLKINQENLELQKTQAINQIQRDILNAKESYINALYVLDTQKQNLITNKNNFERSREQFNFGRVTSIEFRQAQINYLNAINSKNQAKYNAKLAELLVLQVSGVLLDISL